MQWSHSKGIYTDGGEAVSRDTIREVLNTSRERATASMQELMQELAHGNRGSTETARLLKETLKLEYIRNYLPGIGGKNAATPSDWGRLGAMLREQYAYIPRFIRDIASGELTEGQINARTAMFINSAREAYNKARATTAKRCGYDEVAWELHPAIEKHCDTCLQRSAMGYIPIGPKGGFPTPLGECFPGDGSTACLTNDGCELSFRNSTSGEAYSL